MYSKLHMQRLNQNIPNNLQSFICYEKCINTLIWLYITT